MLHVGLVLLLCFSAVNAKGPAEAITDADFEVKSKSSEFALIEFFAPWCGHCKKLAPEFEAAAKKLEDQDNVQLFTVDCTVNTKVCADFGVKGYPTLKWFKDGEASDYNGGRTEATIVSYVMKAIGAPMKVLATEVALNDFKASSGVTVIGFLAAGSSEMDAFQKTSADSTVPLAAVQDVNVGNFAQPSIVIFGATAEPNVFTGPFETAAIAAWVNVNKVPIVIPFTMEAAGDIFGGKDSKIVFLLSNDINPDFTTLATTYRGKFIFSSTDGSVERLNNHIGASKASMPQLILLSAVGQSLQKFPMTGAVTLESMSAHLEAFLSGSMKPVFKSEAAPSSNDGPVKVVVGSTFDDLVINSGKNVLLEIYAPWCGHCKTLAPIYVELGTAVASVPGLVIAKLDGAANEVDGLSWKGFPTIKFYPAGGKNREGEEYSGGRTLVDLEKFVRAKPAPAGHSEL